MILILILIERGVSGMNGKYNVPFGVDKKRGEKLTRKNK